MATNDQQFTQADAESAGWRFTHQADEQVISTSDTQGGQTVTPAQFSAEKYHSRFGASATLITETAETIEKLLEKIGWREQWLGSYASSAPATVTLPAPDSGPGEPNEGETVQITEQEFSSRSRNDVLTVLSDPTDPESDTEQVTLVAGQVVDPSATPEESANESADVAAAEHQDDIDAAKAQRDGNPESVTPADTPPATTSEQTGNGETVVQPEAGAATNASDSEQQSQVNDTEAASSDAVSTNDADAFPPAGQSQPEITGPATPAEAPASAPNALDHVPASEQ